MSEHWKTEPRDELGRWTKDGQGFYRTNTSYERIRLISNVSTGERRNETPLTAKQIETNIRYAVKLGMPRKR